MLYEKKVKYLDYFEGGTRVRGGGFVKLEVRDATLRVELSVTGLHHTDTFARDVMLCGKDREEVCGKVEISAGRGQYRQLWRNLDSIGGTGIGYGELSGFRIPLGAGREVSCRWQEDRGTARRRPQETGRKAAGADGAETMAGDMQSGRREAPAGPGREETDRGNAPVQESAPGDAFGQGSAQESEHGSAPDERDAGNRENAGSLAAGEGAAGGGATGDTSVSAAARPKEQDAAAPGDDPGGSAARGEGELQGSSVERAADSGERMQKETGNMAGGMRRTGEDREFGRRDADSRSKRRSADWAGRDGGSAGAHGNGESRDDAGKTAAERAVREERQKAVPVAWRSRGARGSAASAETAEENREGRRERPSVEWESRGNDRSRASAAGKAVKLMEEKWQQLWDIYPHIRPFQDGREYLSIGPADFVLFSESSYRAVNNSFLLHGYYNYHHLLLARVEQKGEACYYIGVPGNFYEKEKQVAIMFGFESFECAEEPAQAGDFGYYMMRAQI